MNRFMQIVALIALASTASAIEVTTTPGQLHSLIEDVTITELTVSGEMDARDFHYISSELSSLTSLDLSGVTIVAYSDSNRPLTAAVYDYEAATLPHSMLMGMKLERIVLPSTLQAIGHAALAGCDRLTAIEIPASVTAIGDYAFSGSGLQNVSIPSTVQTVGRGAFAHCMGLQSATVGSPVIGDYAFVGDSQLQGVQLSQDVRRIGIEAFHGTGLQSLDASHATGLDSLGNWALASTPLSSVSLPQGMTQMGDGAFFGTTQLSATSMPTALHEVPDYAFAGGSHIVSDTLLHEGVTRIGDYAFYNWSNTRHFFIPGTVSHIGTRAMAGMTGLEEIDVNAAIVPTLGDEVWAGVDQPSVKLGTIDNETAELYASAEQWQEFYIMHYYLLGDVNGDGIVDVTDINLMVNKILGKQAEPFIAQAADINNDGKIDVTDINEVVNMILGKIESTTARRARGRNGNMGPVHPSTDDRVTIEPFGIRPGETRTLDLWLANSQDYSALQLDITLPAGLEMIDGSVAGTSRTAHHSQMMRTHDDRTRVLSFSPQSHAFINNDDALLRIRVKATEQLAPGACIIIDNVVLAMEGRAYAGAGSITPVDNTTGVDDLTANNSRAYATGSTLVIEATQATTVHVVSLNGMVSTLNVPQGRSEWTDLSSGIYIVRLQGNSYKVSLQ